MRRFQVYFYDGSSISIDGANYLDALQKLNIDQKKIMYYKEIEYEEKEKGNTSLF